MRPMRRASRPRYGTISAPVQIQAVAAPLAVVVDVLDLYGRPLRKLEIMTDNAGTLLELLVENRTQLVIRHREQIDRQEIRGGVVLLQEVAVNYARRGGQSQGLDAVHALLVQ